MHLQGVFPEVHDFFLPPAACSYRIALVSIDKRYPGHAHRMMLAIWSWLPQFSYTKFVLASADITAVKIEGRQRSPAYVGSVARIWRQAIDRLGGDPQNFSCDADWHQSLARLSEGSQVTLGPYSREWQ